MLLLVGLAFGTGIRTALIAQRTHLTHDEAISYLAATGHQMAFHEAATGGLDGQWTTAAQWRAYVEPNRLFALNTIRQDLAQTDVHPPLYFWLLHAWFLVFGSGVHSGPMLNLPLFLLTAAALFFLSRQWLCNDLEAAWTVLFYAVSTRTCQASTIARPYELFALCIVLLALALSRLARVEASHPARDALWVCGALLAGMLTHFQFAAPAAGAVVVMGLWLVVRKRSRLAHLAGSVTVAAATWFVLLPRAHEAVARFQAQGDGFTLSEAGPRAARVLHSLVGFVVQEPLWAARLLHPERPRLALLLTAVVLALGGVIALSVLVAMRNRRRMPAMPVLRRPRCEGAAQVGLLFALTAGPVYGMYMLQTRGITSIDPPQYTLVVGVAVAFIPVILVRPFAPGIAQAGLIALALFMMASTVWEAAQPRPATWQPPAELSSARRVVIGSMDRGVLPPILMHVPPETMVFVAPLSALVREPGAWLPEMGADDVFIAHISYANTMAKYEQVADLLREEFALEGRWAFSQGYLVHRLHPDDRRNQLPALPWARFMSGQS